MVGKSRRLLAVATFCVSAGCPAPQAGTSAVVPPATIEIGRDGATLRAIAGDPTTSYAALTATAAVAADGSPAEPTARTVIEARHGRAIAWHVELAGTATALAVVGGTLVATVAGRAPELPVRGDPGTVLLGIDRATGAIAWRSSIDATAWAQVTQLAAGPHDDVVVGGTFAGTLRIGDQVVSSAGRTDGFVARLAPTGAPRWLVRIGGPGADTVQGVATAGDRIAIAGTMSTGAELHGTPLPTIEERTPYGDGFVAELDGAGARRWSATFGGVDATAVAGVAIDRGGRIAVGATATATVQIGPTAIAVHDPAIGVVAWFGPGGAPGPAIAIPGRGIRAIAAAGDDLVIAATYAGTIGLGGRALTAAGGDDAYVAALAPTGNVVAVWPIAGVGREEITALAAVAGATATWIAGIAHTTEATIDREAVGAPHDPLAGAAIAIRPVSASR